MSYGGKYITKGREKVRNGKKEKRHNENGL
jgi:hypothetical protein